MLIYVFSLSLKSWAILLMIGVIHIEETKEFTLFFFNMFSHFSDFLECFAIILKIYPDPLLEILLEELVDLVVSAILMIWSLLEFSKLLAVIINFGQNRKFEIFHLLFLHKEAHPILKFQENLQKHINARDCRQLKVLILFLIGLIY